MTSSPTDTQRPRYPDTWNSRAGERRCQPGDPCDACLAEPIEAPRTSVVIERRLLDGWDTGKGLSGAEWRAWIESLPAGEFATTLLSLADAIDRTDRTGLYGHTSTDTTPCCGASEACRDCPTD